MFKVEYAVNPSLVNVEPTAKGELRGVGYKSFAGLVAMLKRVNKNCLKTGMRTELRIKLPLQRWK